MKFSPRAIKKICVYLIAAACIAWVIKGVRVDDVFLQMRRMNLWWILPAVFLDIFTTVCHGFRWRLLLKPLGSVSLFRSVQAIYTALFCNELFPLKAGEFVRGYVMARRLSAPFSSILPSMVTERIFDGSLLVLGFGLCTLFISLPQRIVNAGAIVGAFMLIAIAGLIVVTFVARNPSTNRRSNPAKRWRPLEHVTSFLSHFTSGMRTLRTSVHFTAILAASILYLFSQVLAYWMVLKAYGLHFSLWEPAVVLIIVRIGTALPSAPANIGPYQFFCVLALTLFGVDKTTATGFAVALWLIFLIPIMVLGFIAFVGSGLTLSEIREGPPTDRSIHPDG